MRSRVIVQPGAGLTPVLEAMRRARRSIDLVIFRLTADDVEDELESAVARGVKVRALVSHTAQGEEDRLRKVEQRLLGAGAAVARSSEDFVRYHGKFLIIDDTFHLLGFNFKKSDVKARSFGIQTRTKQVVQDALRLFECDIGRQPYTAGRSTQLVVSPETSRASLGRFISGARTQLDIYDARLTDPGFIALLLQRAAAGVAIRVIGKAPGLDESIPVRSLKGLKLHVRAMIRDGTHVFVGSQSLRALELDRRREVGLIIANPTAARLMQQVFEGDWENSATKKVEEKEEELESVAM